MGKRGKTEMEITINGFTGTPEALRAFFAVGVQTPDAAEADALARLSGWMTPGELKRMPAPKKKPVQKKH